MARKYSKKASKKVEKAMGERKRGTLRSGRSKKKVTSRKQAVAIGLAEARRSGATVPAKRGRKKTAARKKTPAKKTAAKKTAAKKTASRKKVASRKKSTQKSTGRKTARRATGKKRAA